MQVIQLKKVLRSIRCEEGSATVEFVVLAIPLFLPIFIYLTGFADLSDKENIARVLARESARAFVASRSDSSAWFSANSVARVGAERLGLSASEIGAMRIDINCSESPCISPRGKVEVTIQLDSKLTQRNISATAQEHVSPWV